MYEDFTIKTLKNKNEWYQQFKDTKEFIINSDDRLSNSYRNLWNSDIKEVTVLLQKNEIICLSFFIQKSYWKTDIGELLNRFWLHPNYRGHSWVSNHPVNSKLGINSIGKLMLQVQINFAINNHYKFVFVSRKYPAIYWQKSFIEKFNNWNWISYPKLLWEVRSNADINNAWETCIWLDLQSKHIKNNEIEMVQNYSEFPVFKFKDPCNFPLLFTSRKLYEGKKKYELF